MRINSWLAFVAVVCVSLSAGSTLAESAPARLTPIVVELFTSEGCSSCPPADALLREFDAQPIDGAQIIVLSQHVDYWNSLGWKDPFSSRESTDRQRRYANRLSAGRVYTPQMVVDGESAFVGNRRREAFDAIGAAARAASDATSVRVDVSWIKPAVSSLDVAVTGLSDVAVPLEVLLAITESGLSSDVKSGENAGRKLSHVGVVRRLESLGTVSPSDERFETTRRVRIDSGWNREGLRAVVFVQEQNQGRIVGTGTVRLSFRQVDPGAP